MYSRDFVFPWPSSREIHFDAGPHFCATERRDVKGFQVSHVKPGSHEGNDPVAFDPKGDPTADRHAQCGTQDDGAPRAAGRAGFRRTESLAARESEESPDANRK